MDTKGQLILFVIYVGVGFACGLLYEVFAFLRLLCACHLGKRPYIGAIIDVGFWMGAFCTTLVCAYTLKLPTARIYVWLGFVLGGIIYLKSLRRMVDFFENLCYNKFVSIREKAKVRKNTHKKVREKI